MASSKSKWEAFFKAAGIPSKPASEYATKFCDNRMKLNMLEEINKDVLQELGVRAIGDVIAIMRHSKVQQAEISRERSPSPPAVVEKPSVISASKKTVKSGIKSQVNIPSIQKPTASAAVKTQPQQVKNLSMTVKADAPKSNSSKIKQPRRTLSDRFCEFEREQKKKKVEADEVQDIKIEKEIPATKLKTKATVFTIQLPSKQPVNGNLVNTTTKSIEKKDPKPPKVTLVPAQGKPLNRNKLSTSIFDRLDKKTNDITMTTSTLSSPKTLAVKPKEKKDVFSRLGDLESDEEMPSTSSASSTHTSQKKPREQTVISPFNQSTTQSSSKNVFSRLGDI